MQVNSVLSSLMLPRNDTNQSARFFENWGLGERVDVQNTGEIVFEEDLQYYDLDEHGVVKIADLEPYQAGL